jgi:putative transposase
MDFNFFLFIYNKKILKEKNMARKLRILRNDATYHVTARINRYENAFDLDEFKELFLEVVKESKEKHDFILRNFAIMPNHIHFLIKPGKRGYLPVIMQWILSVFAIRYNKKYKIHGHVWYDRYFSKIIETVDQLVTTFNYISNNPVAAKLAKSSSKYVYTGLYHLIHKIYSIVTPYEYDFIL